MGPVWQHFQILQEIQDFFIRIRGPLLSFERNLKSKGFPLNITRWGVGNLAALIPLSIALDHTELLVSQTVCSKAGLNC